MIEIEWRVPTSWASFVGAQNIVHEDVNTALGWLLDNVEVRGARSCPGDLDGDGEVGSSDLGLLLGSWGDPCMGDDVRCPADFVGPDYVVGPGDLGFLLGLWGACPLELTGGGGAFAGGQMAMQQPSGQVWSQFGFFSLQDYIDWLESLSENELYKHLAELLELLSPSANE